MKGNGKSVETFQHTLSDKINNKLTACTCTVIFPRNIKCYFAYIGAVVCTNPKCGYFPPRRNCFGFEN